MQLPRWALWGAGALGAFAAISGDIGPIQIRVEGGWIEALPAWARNLYLAGEGFVAGVFLYAVGVLIVRTVRSFWGSRRR